jgi:NADH-quinone oxidoreductase subunit J
MLYALYIASFLGAAALLMMMPHSPRAVRALGGVLGGAALGGTWLMLSQRLPEDLGMSRGAFGYHYLFSFLAIASAVRVITHTRPVYSALWFVMVVLASSGLLLVLGAEFVAFAMILIYAGAILVTYVFVLMLAGESSGESAGAWNEAQAPESDRLPREPLAAVACGFLLLAGLLSAAFPPEDQPHRANPRARGLSDAAVRATVLTGRGVERVLARVTDPADRAALQTRLPSETLENAERIGLDLFETHPLGLELAGVILLVSVIGAVVIARQRVEDEPSEGEGVTQPHTQSQTSNRTDAGGAPLAAGPSSPPSPA